MAKPKTPKAPRKKPERSPLMLAATAYARGRVRLAEMEERLAKARGTVNDLMVAVEAQRLLVEDAKAELDRTPTTATPEAVAP